MIPTASFPALKSPQTETFERMARDVALFERQRRLTDQILADQGRQVLVSSMDALAEPAGAEVLEGADAA